MNTQSLPASAGWQWAVSSFALCKRNFMSLFLCVFLIDILSSAVRFLSFENGALGAYFYNVQEHEMDDIFFLLHLLLYMLVFFVMKIGLILGGISVVSKIDIRKRPILTLIKCLFKEFMYIKKYWKSWIIMVFPFAVAFCFVSIVVPFVASLFFAKLTSQDKLFNLVIQVFQRDKLNLTVVWTLLLILPTFVCFLYVPFLTTWRKMPIRKAILTNFRACLKNLGAFIINGFIIAIVIGFGHLSSNAGNYLLVKFDSLFRTFYDSMGVTMSATYACFVLPKYILLFLNVLIDMFLFANFYYSYKAIFPKNDSIDESDLDKLPD